LPYSLFTYFFGYSLGPSLRELHAPDKFQVLRPWLPLLTAGALPVAMGLLAGTFSLRRRQWSLLIWILVPVIILVVLALRNVKPWNPRYVAVVFPWLMALCALGLLRLPRLWGGMASLLLVILTLYSLGGYYWDGRYAKADVRAAVQAVEDLQGAEGAADAILVPVVTSVFHYYYDGDSLVLGTYELGTLSNVEQARAFCDSTLAGRDHLLWVEARPWYFDPRGLLSDELARHGHLRLIEEWSGAKLYSWQRPSEGKANHGS
jgi:hypothetical protein